MVETGRNVSYTKPSGQQRWFQLVSDKILLWLVARGLQFRLYIPITGQEVVKTLDKIFQIFKLPEVVTDNTLKILTKDI